MCYVFHVQLGFGFVTCLMLEPGCESKASEDGWDSWGSSLHTTNGVTKRGGIWGEEETYITGWTE